MKKQVLIFVIIVSLFSIVFVGFSYAYFTLKSNGSVDNKFNVTVGKLKINFEESENISITNGVPIRDEDVIQKGYKNTFSIEHNSDSTLNACFNVQLNVTKLDDRFKSKYFKWALYDKSSLSVVSSGDFSNALTTTPIEILNKQELILGTKKEYNLLIWLSYSDTEDQTYMLQNNSSSAFEGNIKVITKNINACD